MKKALLICVCCLICLSGCTNNNKANYNYQKEEEIEKEIIENLAKITEVTNPTSSNPYEYIENEYYNNIVNLGKEAVPVLENMYKSEKLSGLNAYLSALLVQDITGCNLYEKYNLSWENAEEFYTLWKDNNCSFNPNN